MLKRKWSDAVNSLHLTPYWCHANSGALQPFVKNTTFSKKNLQPLSCNVTWFHAPIWFFSRFLCHTPQRNWIFFFILFVALSHCNKDLFCVSHWVTATNRIFVSCIQNLYMLPKRCPKGPKIQNFLLLFITFCHFLCFWSTFWAFFQNIFCIFGMFLHLRKHI